MTSFGIQRTRAIFYGKGLLLAFGLGMLAGVVAGQVASLVMLGGWAVLCGLAAHSRHMLAWSALCLTPLAMLSALWLDQLGHPDPFGIRFAIASFFLAACMVTAATGILSLHAPMPSPLDRWLKALP